MKKGIAIAGNLIADYVKNIDIYPNEGMLANVYSVKRSIGGCAGNTVIDLAKIDSNIPLTCIGRVGRDENGTYILNTLKDVGVDTNNISISDNEPTSFTDVMFNTNSNERTFFHGRGANAEFAIKYIDFDAFDADIFHIGYALLLDEFDKSDDHYGTKMARALAAAQQRGLRTSIDTVSEDGERYAEVVTPALKYCNYAIINEIEAGRVAGIEPRNVNGVIVFQHLRIICEKFFELGVADLVVIHMPEMGYAMDKHGRHYHVNSYELPKGFIKGTVGAGDAFCAGMLYSLYQNSDMNSALSFANAAAACCLSAEDAVDGMVSKAEIEKLQNRLKVRE